MIASLMLASLNMLQRRLFLFFALDSSGAAQWLNYPTPGIATYARRQTQPRRAGASRVQRQAGPLRRLDIKSRPSRN